VTAAARATVEFDRRSAAFRFAVTALLLAVVFANVGWSRVLRHLRHADVTLWLLAPAVAAVALFAGGEGNRVALGFERWSGPSSLARRAFYGATIVRNFLPAGNVGAGGFVAYTVSRHEDVEVSVAAAGVTGWEVVLMVASAVVGSVGLAGVVAAGGSATRGAELLAGVAALLAAVAVIGVALSRFRGRVARGVARAATLVRSHLPTGTDGAAPPVRAEAVRRGLDRFFATLRTLATERERATVVFVAALSVWLGWALPLYVSLLAVGVSVSPAVVLVALPVSGFARAVPLPAGVGPVDAAIGGVLAAFTPYGVGALASALVLYRASMLLVQVSVGAVALWTLDDVARPGAPVGRD
jgi:uncharacterized protein (TIRG00374 family)